jgi:hypothetical protein
MFSFQRNTSNRLLGDENIIQEESDPFKWLLNVLQHKARDLGGPGSRWINILHCESYDLQSNTKLLGRNEEEYIVCGGVTGQFLMTWEAGKIIKKQAWLTNVSCGKSR